MKDWKKRGMPVLGHSDVLPFPWDLVEPHRDQAMKNHGQTLERLAERGGLDPAELLAVLEDRAATAMAVGDAFLALAQIVKRANDADNLPRT